MIRYKELHLSPHFEEDMVIEEEITKFVINPRAYIAPSRLSYQSAPGTYLIDEVYNVTGPFFFGGEYLTWLDVFKNEGWKLLNTYWKVDHRVMVFIKDAKNY